MAKRDLTIYAGKRRPDAKKPSKADEEILQRIKAKKEERNRNRSNSGGHERNVLRKILGPFMKAGKTYPMADIEAFIEMAGGKYTSAGPATTFGVRNGYLIRVGRGQYKVTGKKIEKDRP